MIIKKLFNYFIPLEMRNDIVANTRARIFIGSALVISLVMFLNAYRGFASNDIIQGISIVVGAIFLLSTFWILKASRSNLLAGNIFIGIFYVVLFSIIYRSAGPVSMTHLFFAVLTLLSFLICGFRSGMVWGALVILQLIAFKVMASSGHQFAPLRLDVIFVSLLILLIMVFILAAVYEKSSESSLRNFASEKDKSERTSQILEDMFENVRLVMSGVATGDLSKRISVEAEGSLAILKESINSSLQMLSQTILQVTNVSDEINTSMSHVTTAAQSLASGTTEQAASLEEISSSMENIGAKAKTNSANAQQAQVLSNQTSSEIFDVNKQMDAMLDSMNKINQTSSDVSKVVKVIEEIAFQTNLLALNAAVEAARAGKYGKGFSVVAEEVRNLAGRSAEATKDTSNLIENSMNEVEHGVKNANDTAEALQGFVENINKVKDFVGEISVASQDQAAAAEQINTSLSQVNDVVQQNSSISEETSSAAQDMRSQSEVLYNMMDKFKLTN